MDGVQGLGERLRRAREIAGMTGDELAAALGLGKRGGVTISEWENDKVKSLKAANLQALSAHLNVSIDWLVHGPRTEPGEFNLEERTSGLGPDAGDQSTGRRKRG